MSNQKSRRTILKQLTLTGVGFFILGCDPNKPQEIEDVLQPILMDKDSLELEKQVDILEEKLQTEHVLLLSEIDEDYEKYRNGFNLNHQKHPKIIALCYSTLGVQQAIKYANRTQLKLAVKSGGHSFEGFSSIDNGLQLNLSLMNTANWDETGEYLIAQPAVLLKDLYDFILPNKKIIPVGSCGTLGIAGLTLGGGYGFFSRSLGLTCDSLMEATFIDANGQKHMAKAGDELMWALRGGGNGNFGVVTELKFKTYQAPETFQRYRLQAYNLDTDRAKDIMKTWFEYSQFLPNKSFSAHVLNGTTVTILITNYGEDDTNIENLVDALSPKMDKISVGNRKKIEDSLSTYFGTMYPIYFKNSSAGYYNDFSDIENCIDDIINEVAQSKLIYQINTLGGQIANPNFEQNSCYPHRQTPYLCELQSYWKKDHQKDNKIKGFARIQTLLKANNINKQYRNYPNIDFKDWANDYYGENYVKLQALKAKYDPNNLFDHLQSVRRN